MTVSALVAVSSAAAASPFDLTCDADVSDAATATREWRPGHPEMTEFLGGGAYRVTRCAPDGDVVKSVTAAPVRLPNGNASYVPTMMLDAENGSGKAVFLTYGAVTTDAQAEEFKRSLPAIRDKVLPPSAALPESAVPVLPATKVASRKRRLLRVAADTSCSDHIFKGIGFNWSWWGRSYGYYVRTSTVPGGDSGRQSIQGGHHSWNNTVNGCGLGDQANITMSYAGSTTRSVTNGPDGYNVVDFGSVTTIGCAGAIACTWSYFHPNYGIFESDVRFSSSGVTWSNSGASNGIDIRSVAAHETGHTIGLGDVYGAEHNFLTMYYQIAPGWIRARDLALGDVLGMRAIYPG